MTKQRRIRALGAAGLLCTALAACGTAATAAAAPAASPTGGQNAALSRETTAQRVGCASVNEATMVRVTRDLLIVEPLNAGPRTYIQRNPRLVRALFGDFCAAITHADIPHPLAFCPADFGISYSGTFYDEQRVLATFIYYATGCARLSLTASGKTRDTFLIGTAAAATPHLRADFAAVLGLPESQVYGPPGSQSIGPSRQPQ